MFIGMKKFLILLCFILGCAAVLSYTITHRYIHAVSQGSPVVFDQFTGKYILLAMEKDAHNKLYTIESVGWFEEKIFNDDTAKTEEIPYALKTHIVTDLYSFLLKNNVTNLGTREEFDKKMKKKYNIEVLYRFLDENGVTKYGKDIEEFESTLGVVYISHRVEELYNYLNKRGLIDLDECDFVLKLFNEYYRRNIYDLLYERDVYNESWEEFNNILGF